MRGAHRIIEDRPRNPWLQPWGTVNGHARTLSVNDGDRVSPGQQIAEAGALGAPDGCHLHLEQRSVGGGLSTATEPTEILALTS